MESMFSYTQAAVERAMKVLLAFTKAQCFVRNGGVQ